MWSRWRSVWSWGDIKAAVSVRPLCHFMFPFSKVSLPLLPPLYSPASLWPHYPLSLFLPPPRFPLLSLSIPSLSVCAPTSPSLSFLALPSSLCAFLIQHSLDTRHFLFSPGTCQLKCWLQIFTFNESHAACTSAEPQSKLHLYRGRDHHVFNWHGYHQWKGAVAWRVPVNIVPKGAKKEWQEYIWCIHLLRKMCIIQTKRIRVQ